MPPSDDRPPTRSEDVTQLLQRWQQSGDREAEEQLFVVVQSELLKIARRALRSHPGVVARIDPAELVSEAYMALRDYPIIASNRRPFFELMGRAMRHFLIDLARRRAAQRRPPTHLRVNDTNALGGVAVSADVGPIEFYEALDALRQVSDRQAQTIEWKVLGMTNEEIAAAQGISLATVKRDVENARAFLKFKGLGG